MPVPSWWCEPGIHVAKIPEREGEAITRKQVTSDNRAVADFEAHDLQKSLKVMKRVALAKDPHPVRIELKASSIVLSAKSSAGSVQDEIAAKCRAKKKCGLSYELIAPLAARARGHVVLGVRREKEEVTRITLKCGELYLVMLTVPQS